MTALHASEDPGPRLMDSFVGVKRKCSSNRAAKVTKLVCEMVARDLRPVSIVEGNGFRQLINYLEPDYQVPSHMHISTVCHRMYQVERDRVKAELHDRRVVIFGRVLQHKVILQ